MTLTLTQWAARLNAASDLRPLALEAVESAARAGVKAAQRTVPVDTGRLRASIGIGEIAAEISRVTATFEARTTYAGFVEFGTARMGPRPYMRTAAREITPLFKRNAEVVGVEALTRSLT